MSNIDTTVVVTTRMLRVTSGHEELLFNETTQQPSGNLTREQFLTYFACAVASILVAAIVVSIVSTLY